MDQDRGETIEKENYCESYLGLRENTRRKHARILNRRRADALNRIMPVIDDHGELTR